MIMKNKNGVSLNSIGVSVQGGSAHYALGPCFPLIVGCSFARYYVYDCVYFSGNYRGGIFIRSWVLFLCFFLAFLFS